MSTVSLQKGIPEGILEFHVSKFRYWLSRCVVVWKELPNKCTRSEHFSSSDLLLGFLRNVLRVLQLRTFPSLQTWIRVSKVFSDFFFLSFFFFMDKLEFFFFYESCPSSLFQLVFSEFCTVLLILLFGKPLISVVINFWTLS